MGFGKCELSSVQPTDLAVGLVRAEGRVGKAKAVEHSVEEVVVDSLVTDVDDHRHAHNVLDAPEAGSDCGHRHQTFFSSTSAACRDWMYALLESLAPEII